MTAITSRLAGLALGITLALFVVSAPAEASTITVNSIAVTTGGVTYDNDVLNLSPQHQLVDWTFPVVLNTGEDLILSQDSHLHGAPNTGTSYNFDTSDNPIGGVPTTPRIDITVNGITTTFFDTNQVLNVKNQGSVDTNLNEAQNYGAPLVGPGYLVFLGYADNVHPNACGAYATSLALNGSTTCFPSPFPFGTPRSQRFQSVGGVNPGLTQTLLNHCSTADCYDAGVVRIVAVDQAVPEPATMALLVTGLVGFAVRRHGQARKARASQANPD